MRSRAFVAAFALAACGGPDPGPVCPRVAAVAGLDRLDYHYGNLQRPVRARLDVVDGACIYEEGAFTVRSTVAIRLDPDRPAGEFRIPYSIAIDMAEGTALDRADFAVIPPGSNGVVEIFEHRVEGVGEGDGQRVRILYALTPDDTELQRLVRERPRPAGG